VSGSSGRRGERRGSVGVMSRVRCSGVDQQRHGGAMMRRLLLLAAHRSRSWLHVHRAQQCEWKRRLLQLHLYVHQHGGVAIAVLQTGVGGS